jgi:hypothetical protein
MITFRNSNLEIAISRLGKGETKDDRERAERELQCFPIRHIIIRTPDSASGRGRWKGRCTDNRYSRPEFAELESMMRLRSNSSESVARSQFERRTRVPSISKKARDSLDFNEWVRHSQFQSRNWIPLISMNGPHPLNSNEWARVLRYQWMKEPIESDHPFLSHDGRALVHLVGETWRVLGSDSKESGRDLPGKYKGAEKSLPLTSSSVHRV